MDRVSGNKHTWVGKDTWAAKFHVDESTIKRWIAKLVQVGLIRRQRRFGTSSCTYITAYDRRTMVLDGAATVD